MDTRHLIDPELLPLVEKYANFALNEKTLGGLRQAISDASASSNCSNEGLSITVDRRSVPRLDGAGYVPIVVVAPAATRPGRGAVLHLHGGGFVTGSPEQNLPRLREQVAQLDCVLVSVDYPLAPEAVFPAAVEASYSVLCWLAGEADSLGVDPQRIGVAGESAGGGLAAALALLAFRGTRIRKDLGRPRHCGGADTWPRPVHRRKAQTSHRPLRLGGTRCRASHSTSLRRPPRRSRAPGRPA
jgi:acetyl esterase/lipase